MAEESSASQLFEVRIWHGSPAMRRARVRRAEGGEWTDVSTPAALLDYWQAVMTTGAPSGSGARAGEAAQGSQVLRLHVLGTFSAQTDRVVAPPRRKAQKRCFDLLKAIVALGGRKVDQRRLADALWPDAEADRARQNLKATLHRLRELLGKHTIVLREGKLSLVDEYCWLDSWVFEHHLDSALALPPDAPASAWTTHLEAALHLYRGALLPDDDDAPFVLVQRERLNNKLRRTIESGAAMLLAADRVDACVALVERGLDIDPLQERLYETLMRAHLAAGRPVDALRAYQRCAGQLRACFGIVPAATLDALRAQACRIGRPKEPATLAANP